MDNTALQEVIMRLENANENVPCDQFEHAIKVCKSFLYLERTQIINAYRDGRIDNSTESEIQAPRTTPLEYYNENYTNMPL